jgi:hypothetical protein
MARTLIVLSLVAVILAAGAAIMVAVGWRREAPRPSASAPAGGAASDDASGRPADAAAADGADGANRPGRSAASTEAARESSSNFGNDGAAPRVQPGADGARMPRSRVPRPADRPAAAVSVERAPDRLPRRSIERMTPEERADRERRQQDHALYRLPSAYRAQMLERTTDPQLQVTSDQQARLAAIEAQMLERSREALGDVIAEHQELMAELQELSRRRSEIQQQLEAEYRSALRDVLTAEQMEVIEGRRKAAPAVEKPMGEP